MGKYTYVALGGHFRTKKAAKERVRQLKKHSRGNRYKKGVVIHKEPQGYYVYKKTTPRWAERYLS
jgi:Fe-S oxidoreductase